MSADGPTWDDYEDLERLMFEVLDDRDRLIIERDDALDRVASLEAIVDASTIVDDLEKLAYAAYGEKEQREMDRRLRERWFRIAWGQDPPRVFTMVAPDLADLAPPLESFNSWQEMVDAYAPLLRVVGELDDLDRRLRSPGPVPMPTPPFRQRDASPAA